MNHLVKNMPAGCLLLSISLMLFGCSGGVLDGNIRKIAVLNVAADLRMQDMTASKGVLDHALDMAMADARNLEEITVETMKEDEEVFLFKTMSSVSERIQTNVTGVEVVTAKDLYQGVVYNSFEEDVTDKKYVFVPAPYRYINVSNPENARKYCEELGVDAVAAVRLKYEGQRYRDFFQLPFTPDGYKVWARLTVDIYDRSGNHVANRYIKVLSDKWMPHEIVRPGFTLHDNRRELFLDVTQKMLVELDKIARHLQG